MRLLKVTFLLTFGLLLSACGTLSGPSPRLPDALLYCADAPSVPEDTANSRDVALYIVDLHAAHADCSSKLGAVRKALND